MNRLWDFKPMQATRFAHVLDFLQEDAFQFLTLTNLCKRSFGQFHLTGILQHVPYGLFVGDQYCYQGTLKRITIHKGLPNQERVNDYIFNFFWGNIFSLGQFENILLSINNL
mmetsp:Transcript_53094/g.154626  ORF Transcript_53094/g.154626 Transcript_53094/m.154626 type:complete len:112 (+) Transcript_53094:202-537(+)